MHLGEAADKLLRIVDVIDAKLQLRLVTGVKMELRLLAEGEGLIGAQDKVRLRCEGAWSTEQKESDQHS
jgi:hypothetical protein